MSSTSEDDWEKDNVEEIKINLASLNITTTTTTTVDNHDDGESPSVSSSSRSKPAVIMPSYLDSVDDGEFNFNRHDNDRIQDDKISIIDEPIHTALLTAAANPKERMFVLHLEDTLLKFVQSDDVELEYPGAMNSFRRLLVYQSVYRFHLSHTIVNNNNYYDSNDPGIILIFKTTETKGCIPKQLLIDLDNPSAIDSDLVSPPISNDNDNRSIAPKKVLMMKRNPSNSDIKKDNIKAKQENSSADKERAYAEARARIFGNLVENNGESINNDTISDSSNGKANTISRPSSASPALSNAKGSSDSLKSQDDAVGNNRTLSSSNLKEEYGDTTNSDQTKSKVLLKSKKPIDVNSWKGNKAIEKNQLAELTDPDFLRTRDANPNMSNGQGQGYYDLQPEAYSEQQYYYANNGVYNNYPTPPQGAWAAQPMYPPQYQYYQQQQYQPQQQYPQQYQQQYATRQQYGENPRNYRNNPPS